MINLDPMGMLTGTTVPQGPEQAELYFQQLEHLNRLSARFSTALDTTLDAANKLTDKKGRIGTNKVSTADYEKFFSEDLLNIDRNAIVLITGDKQAAAIIDAEGEIDPNTNEPKGGITTGLRDVFQQGELATYLKSKEYKDPTTTILLAIDDTRNKLRRSLEKLDKKTIKETWTPEQKQKANIDMDNSADESKSIEAYLQSKKHILEDATNQAKLKAKVEKLDTYVKQLNPREQQLRENKLREGHGITSKFNEKGLKSGLIFGSVEFIVRTDPNDPEKTTVRPTGLPIFFRNNIDTAKAFVRTYFLAKHEAYAKKGGISMKEILNDGITIKNLQVGTCPEVLLDFLANVQAVAEGLGIPREKVTIKFLEAKAYDGHDQSLVDSFHTLKEKDYMNKLEGKGSGTGALGRVTKHIDKIISDSTDGRFFSGSKILPPDVVNMENKQEQRTEAFRIELLGSAYYSKQSAANKADVTGKDTGPNEQAPTGVNVGRVGPTP